MVVRINNPTYSVANKSISTSDQRDADGHGGGRHHEEQEEHSSKEILVSKKSVIGIDELQVLIEQLNASEYYQKKGFTFSCRDDAKDLHVEVRTTEGKLIQRVPPDQIQKMVEALNLEHSSSKVGSLINVSC